jgi:hypothetical protein
VVVNVQHQVSIHIATIELVNPACSIKSKDSLAPPRIVNTRGAEQNVLQIYTQVHVALSAAPCVVNLT